MQMQLYDSSPGLPLSTARLPKRMDWGEVAAGIIAAMMVSHGATYTLNRKSKEF